MSLTAIVVYLLVLVLDFVAGMITAGAIYKKNKAKIDTGVGVALKIFNMLFK
jgi:hypothetical protein